MKIRTHLDVIEIGGEELEEIVREAVRERHGRELDQITWCNPIEKRRIDRSEPTVIVNINATLKPKE